MNQMTPTTTVPAVPKPATSNYGYIIIALVVIVVLAVIAYALTCGQKGRQLVLHKFYAHKRLLAIKLNIF